MNHPLASVSADGTESKGAIKFAVPFGAAVVAILFVMILVYPIMKLSPHDVPVAVLSKDAGAEVAGTYLNAGDELIAQLTGSEDEEGATEDAEAVAAIEESDGTADSTDDEAAEDSADDEAAIAEDSTDDEAADSTLASSSSTLGSDVLTWTVFDNEDDLNAAMQNNEYYLAIIIPEDFSTRMAAQQGRDALGSALVEKLPELASGASALAEGANTLSSGSTSLASGLSTIDQGTSTLSSALSQLPTQTDKLASGATSAATAANSLASGAEQLSGSAGQVATGAEQLAQNPAYASQMASSLASGTQAVAGGTEQLAQGASSLASGLSSLEQGTSALSSGLSQLPTQTSKLASGTTSAAQGASQLASGAATLAEGAQTLADGLATANETLSGLPQAEGNPTVQVVVNQGKNPMVTNSIEPSLVALEAMGVQMEKTYSVQLPTEMQRGFSHMPLMIMTYLTSYIAAAVIALRLPVSRASRKACAKGLLVQVATAFFVALFAGFACALVFQAMLGMDVDWQQLGLLMVLSSFALQLIVVGCLDLFGIAGMAVPLLLMAFCMTSAYLPYEFLPSFWQENIYPWNPLRHMVDAYKQVIYFGGGFMNASTPYVFVVAAIGLAVMLLNLMKPAKKQEAAPAAVAA